MSYTEDQSGQFQTPMKDLPPSLSYGSSSSPYFDSSPAYPHFQGWVPPARSPSGLKSANTSMQRMNYPPEMHHGRHISHDIAYGHPYTEASSPAPSSFSQLLPAEFPHRDDALGSSPPTSQHLNRHIYADQSASPHSKPPPMRVPAKRGRPRKYPAPDKTDVIPTVSTAPTQTGPFAASVHPDNHGQPRFIRSPRKRQRSTVIEGQAPTGQVPAVKKQKAQGKPINIHKNELEDKEIPTITPPGDRKMSIYTDKPTSNGVPLISANAFRIACDLQGARKRASLRELFSDYKQHEKRHFSTNGLGFNFMIDTTGSASIDKTQAVPDSPHGPQRDQNSVNTETPRIIDVLDEESDSDSEAEYEPSGASSASNPVRTPPRFSSLGNSDAATEFARTFGRSHDRGFMFLFPNESTPSKPVSMPSNSLSTPRTPKIPMPFDEDSFSMQMQTPPGAVFSSYDYHGGNFVTGMTPYINGLENRI